MRRLVVRNGTVVDGTGSSPRRADVLVEDGTIVDVGDVDHEGAEELDATDRIVTPGFVDPHTHLDAQLFWDPAPQSLHHGVTTAVLGICGFGIAPATAEGREYLLKMLEVVEDIPYACTSIAVPFEWSTYAEYLAALERARPALNVGGMVPHSALRFFVMGERGLDGPADERERKALADELRRSIEAGALGFATSRAPNMFDFRGEPIPSRRADDLELQALVEQCRNHVWQINIEAKVSATADPINEEVEKYAAWTRRSDANLTWAPLPTEPDEAVWRGVLERNEALNQEALVAPQVIPIAITTSLRFDRQSKLATLVVGWERAMTEFFALDLEGRRARIADPEFRATLRDAPAVYERVRREQGAFGRGEGAEVSMYSIPPEFDGWFYITSRTHPEVVGFSLVEAAARVGASPTDLLCDVVVDDELTTELLVPVGNRDLDAAATLSADAYTLIGLGDSGAHMQMSTAYSYTTELLARVVRDEGRIPIEQAVQRITSRPAQVFKIPRRGQLTPGYSADICVIDLERLALGPLTYRDDLPGGASRIYRGAVGYSAVLVNGETTLLDDEWTGTRRGENVMTSRT